MNSFTNTIARMQKIAAVSLYIGDVGTDGYQTSELYNNCHFRWFGLSLAIMCLPQLVYGVTNVVIAIMTGRFNKQDIFSFIILPWITIKDLWNGESGTKTWEIFFESFPQLVF
eukprot:GFUD01093184.1.p1 GENE.GFUD01093184.1~~GFUD01093184.1.p1  ORF type:complete len:113 (-),score=1.71 GFUD01093184.1:149-487(-)